MARRKIPAGTTSCMVPIFVQDTSSTIGAGLGSLSWNTAGLAAKYRREGQADWTPITLATATVGTFTSGGFIADGGPVTGGYELGVPNAAIASGATWSQVACYGATNMLPVLLEFELDAINYQDGVRAGLTALPSAAAEAAGGLYTRGSGAGQIAQPSNGVIKIDHMGPYTTYTVASGSSSSAVKTNCAEDDDYFPVGTCIHIATSAGKFIGSSYITSFANTEGLFTLTDSLGFTPSAGMLLIPVGHVPQ